MKRILTDNLERFPGGRVEIAEVGNRYLDVCKAEGRSVVSQDTFIAEAEEFCEAIGIKRKKIGIYLYLMDVKLAPHRNKTRIAAASVGAKRLITSAS